MSVRAAFAGQADSCAALGSPLTAQICRLLGAALQPEQGAVARRVLGWPGDASSRGDSVPLRLCGALHGLVLAGQAPALAAAYARGTVEAGLLLAAIAAHEGTVMHWLDRPPQTNEVARAAAIIAAARFATRHVPLPLEVLELGASAGLNLNFHRFLLVPDRGAAPDPGVFGTEEAGAKENAVILRPAWRGDLPEGALEMAAAEGVDLRPLELADARRRLPAYCWPDQPDRMARLRAALATAAAHPPQLVAGDAADFLDARLAQPAPGRLRFVYHTVAWQYFPPDVQARCDAALAQAGAAATRDAPLAHFGMEADGKAPGAGLHLRLWDGQAHSWALGRADFHGRWVDWAPYAV